MDELHGDARAGRLVDRLMDHAHPALPEQSLQSVPGSQKRADQLAAILPRPPTCGALFPVACGQNPRSHAGRRAHSRKIFGRARSLASRRPAALRSAPRPWCASPHRAPSRPSPLVLVRARASHTTTRGAVYRAFRGSGRTWRRRRSRVEGTFPAVVEVRRPSCWQQAPPSSSPPSAAAVAAARAPRRAPAGARRRRGPAAQAASRARPRPAAAAATARAARRRISRARALRASTSPTTVLRHL